MAPGGWVPPDLVGQVALVTGASRGVGRGVALALGEAGATVYVTGRSSRGTERTEGLPGTIEDTAEAVTDRGGVGIAIRCDHFVDAEVEALFERIGAEGGGLDLLVNNAWAGYQRGEDAPFDATFWKQPIWRWDLFADSLRGQFVAARLAARTMTERRRGLIVNVGFTDHEVPLGNVAYDVVKHSSDRMVVSMARELARRDVWAVALHPGFVRTERVEAAWDLLGDGPAQVVHTPEYVGRAVACLLADPDLASRTGEGLAVGDLADEYGFADIDGRRPPAFRLEGRITLAARMQRLNRVAARAAAGEE
jgi:NAD(P)-dependent dehydrogenase (short-subunit alcohol dehydrogenase family)